MKKASLQYRAVRKWQCHIILMNAETVEDVEPKDEEEDPNIQVTAEAFILFIWWLASPKPQRSSSSEVTTHVSDNCGYSFSYVEVLIQNLMSYIEEKGWLDSEKGLHVDRGDVVALREVAIVEMMKVRL